MKIISSPPIESGKTSTYDDYDSEWEDSLFNKTDKLPSEKEE